MKENLQVNAGYILKPVGPEGCQEVDILPRISLRDTDAFRISL